MTKGWEEVRRCIKRIERLEQGKAPRKLSKEDKRILWEYFRNVGVSCLIGIPLLLYYIYLIQHYGPRT